MKASPYFDWTRLASESVSQYPSRVVISEAKGDLSLSAVRFCYESCSPEAARITEVHLPVRFTNEAAVCRHLGHIVRTNTAPASGLDRSGSHR